MQKVIDGNDLNGKMYRVFLHLILCSAVLVQGITVQAQDQVLDGIGETGLDYYWDKTFIPLQKQNFQLHDVEQAPGKGSLFREPHDSNPIVPSPYRGRHF